VKTAEIWSELVTMLLKKIRGILEFRNNRYYVSHYHRSGVGEVGMLRSEIETSREILMEAKSHIKLDATDTTSCKHSESVLFYKEVGMAHSSADVSVIEHRTKQPYLIDVNREEKDM